MWSSHGAGIPTPATNHRLAREPLLGEHRATDRNDMKVKAVNPIYLLVGLSMLAAAGLAVALTPRMKLVDQPSIDLESMIPPQFGEWKLEQSVAPMVISPDVKALLDKIYNQTLSRNYRNSKGDRIMLSIAYGSGQGYSTQVHRPEVCYPAQGFLVKSMAMDSIDVIGHKLPVAKLVATHGRRVEPITYWIMIGDSPVRGNWEQHFARLRYGLSGKIPHGLVIRVSTISENETESYRAEEQFLRAMLSALPVEHRALLAGEGSSQRHQ